MLETATKDLKKAIFYGAMLFFLFSCFLSGTDRVFAQELDPVAKRQAELQAELDATNKDIEYWAGILDSKRKETASISRDVDILNAKIAEAKAKIRAKNIVIQQLSKDIGKKSAEVDILVERMERGKSSLSAIMRQINEIDSNSVAEVVLSSKEFSEFFAGRDSMGSVTKSMNTLFAELRQIKGEVENEMDVLSRKKAAETDAKVAIESEQRQIQKSEAEKKELLAISKNQEKTYQGILSERQKKAAQIRSALFALRDTAAIPFGTAYNYALEVEKKTGIRPAFLLAILTQESNLGENVGQCYLTNFTTGAGVGKNTGRAFRNVMKPDRDVKPFLDLANRLGFDPKTREVSCPQSVGYGGAMGPSQFIPSTWASLENRIAKTAGVDVPDPWIPRDAFFASGVYLSDLGAGSGGYTAEHTAAAKYYAGGNWRTLGQGYANSVMKHAQNIQEGMIDPLQNI